MGQTISFSQGRVAELHDKRIGKDLPKNVDPSLSHNNKDFTPDEFKGRSYESCFNDYFQQSVDANNSKQKRKSRKIDNYFKHISDSKTQKPLYEYVLQCGSHADGSLDDTPEGRKIREAVDNALQRLPDEFPKLKFVLLKTHADEPNGSYHGHITFMPTATGYAKGMPERCALKEAFAQMGYDTSSVVYLKQFKHRVESILEEEMEKLGLERAYGDKGFSKDPKDKSHRPHMDVPAFRLHEEAETLYAEAEDMQVLNERVAELQEMRAEELEEREKAVEQREEQLKNEIIEAQNGIITAYRDYDTKRMQIISQIQAINKSKADLRSMILSGDDTLKNEFIELHKEEFDKFVDDKLGIDTSKPEKLENPEIKHKHKPEEPEKVIEPTEDVIDEIEAVIPEEELKTPSKASDDDYMDEIPEEYRDDPMKAMKWYQENMWRVEQAEALLSTAQQTDDIDKSTDFQ